VLRSKEKRVQKIFIGIILLALGMEATACSSSPAATTVTQPPSQVATQDMHPTQTKNMSIETAGVFTEEPTMALQPNDSAEPAIKLDKVLPLVSQDRMLAYLEALTAIQPYSGWRNSATEGEAEALAYVAGEFEGFDYLKSLGMELEQQTFGVFNATELWETRLFLKIDGDEIEVPADGIRGHRDDNSIALRFDSDGELGDVAHNPLEIDRPMLFAGDLIAIHALTPEDVKDKILFIPYTSIHRITLGSVSEEIEAAKKILALNPAGIVLVTRFSNQIGDAHGAFVGDGNAFTRIEIGPETPAVPVLYTRLEDLATAGIVSWDDFSRMEAARLVWDADVISPGVSGNLVATIPGVDRSRAVILSAHIDSPNGPGALDDGSGSVVLMEIARVINAARLQPAADLVLVWYGSEEIGLYGSAHFVATHQELLDRTLAMLQVDCLTRPLDQIEFTHLILTTWSYGRLGDERLVWPEYMSQAAAQYGIETTPVNRYQIESDNTPFGGFDVPNANMAYISPQMEMRRFGSVHYAGHLHSPYDTVALTRDVADILEQMAQVTLIAALKTAQEAPQLRVTPTPDRRAVIVASHTEAELMSPAGFTDFGMTLAMQGYDVDLIPYGQPVGAENLADADLVVALPLLDFATDQMRDYPDEKWTEAEIALLESYVARGGFLVLTNSARRIKTHNWIFDPNEDWRDVNVLAEHFGIQYTFGAFPDRVFWVAKLDHPLLEKVSYLELMPDNAIPIRIDRGTILAPQFSYRASIALVSHGKGEVLALADAGMLGNVGMGTPENLNFWSNLARYVRAR
jgi:hypothetical protein